MSPHCRRHTRLAGLLVAGAVVCTPLAPAQPRAAPDARADDAAIQERLDRVRADLFSGRGRPDEAIDELKAILALDARSAEGHMLLGIAYRTLGSVEMMAEARAELRQALSLDPRFLPARLYLAQLYLDIGRAGRARDELETALQQAPGQPQLLTLLGEAERQLGNPEQALELTARVLDAEPSFAEARYYRGLALLDLDRTDEAVRELERVAGSGAATADLWLHLGEAYLDQGRETEALEAFRTGVRSNPSRPDLRIQLARAYRARGLLDEAAAELAHALPDGGAMLASAYYQQVESAAFVEQGLIALERGQLDAAAGALEKALDVDPDQGEAALYLADVYLRLDRPEAALEQATRAEALGQTLPDALQTRLKDRQRDHREDRPR